MGERFDDATAKSGDPFVREVSIHPDCEGGPHWLVEWERQRRRLLRDDVRWPMAERPARDYFHGQGRPATPAGPSRARPHCFPDPHKGSIFASDTEQTMEP
jgi:hypothetical protein